MDIPTLLSVYRGKKRFGNLLSLVRKKGSFLLSDGTLIRFDRKRYGVARDLLIFSNLYGVKFNSGEWRLDLESETITTPSGIKFSLEGFSPLIFYETFVLDAHFVCFDLEGKVVVQAGGYTGDTALYYAQRGAKVYSFEPNPNSYRVAKKNIELNPHLKQRIVMENYAIGDDGVVKFPVDPTGSGDSSIYSVQGKQTVDVRSVSLNSILKTYGIWDPYLLDLDVKGCEFKVVEEEAIERFRVVRIEYTTKVGGVKLGERDQLVEKLRRHGFTQFRIYKHSHGLYDLTDHGTIEAKKPS